MLPGLAPLTFPLAIGVIASQRYVKYLGKVGSSLEGLLNMFLYVQVAVALLVIVYVVYRATELLIRIWLDIDVFSIILAIFICELL